jgi:hypothetical protein
MLSEPLLLLVVGDEIDGEKPGPITNDALLNPDGTPRVGLRVTDYRVLHEPVCKHLFETLFIGLYQSMLHAISQ